jgi:hypothetical protein
VFDDDDSPWLDDADCGRTLYSKFEAGCLCGIHPTAMVERLKPVAYLLNAHRRLSLYREKDIIQLRHDVASGEVKLMRRSLNSPRQGVYMADAFHVHAHDVVAERQRVSRLRQTPAAWSRLV